MWKSAAALLLILAQAAAAGDKSAGTVTVLGDSPEYPSGTLGAMGGVSSRLDGAIAPASWEKSSFGGVELEGGFYSRMVQPPLAPDYSAPSTAAYTLAWGGANPAGTRFEVTVSTWAEADPYMAWYTPDASGYPVESLGPNTTYYNFIFANYMDGDYSPRTATAAVTLAVTPSSGVFTLEDAGHNTLAVSFAGFENPHGLSGLPWAADAPALPAARYGQASAAYGPHIFVSGGFNGVAFSSAVYRSSAGASGELGPWSLAGYMPAARYAHQLVAARGRLYLLGGYDASGSRAEVWSADISSTGAIGTWLAEPQLPLQVYFHAAAAGYGRIYVSGGYTSGSGVQSAVCQSQLGDDGAILGWACPLSLPAPRYSHSLTLMEGRLYAAGGKDGASTRSEVWSAQLTPEGNLPGAWNNYTPLPSPRSGHRALAYGNRLFVIGGSNGSTPQPHVFMSSAPPSAAGLSPWQAYRTLPEARQFQSGEVLPGRLCVFGGSSGSSPRAEVYCSSVTGTEYLVEVSSSAVFDPPYVRSYGWRGGAFMRDGGLEPGLQYYFRAKARNWTGLETPYSAVGSTVTYAAVPGTAAWTNITPNAMRANWTASGNPAGYTYAVVYSTSPDYLPPSSVQTTALNADLGGLNPSTTYYAKVRVANPGGRYSRYAELPPARTTFNPALDVTDPAVNDLQADFTDWKGTNTFGCAVQFTDSGGSGLDYFEVQVATDPGGASGIVAAWATVKSGIGADSYNTPWQLPQNVWEQLPEGASGYVSVRVYDGSGNNAQVIDAFSLVKDTTPPQVTVTYSPPAVWYTEYPGDVTGLRFETTLAGLARVQYSVSANKSFADAAVIPWTDIPGFTAGDALYEPVLTYDFPQLANATSNYFSFRAVDLAGSTRTLVDAFGIGKNVSGPVVTISTPTGPFLSTFTYVSGNSLPTNAHPVEGTEVYLRDMSNGLYYSAGAFLSGSRVWHEAEDVASTFTVAFANLPLVSGRQYQAVARSSDSVGDYSQVFATYTFTFDTLPPSAAVVYPPDGSTADSAASVNGTAGDASSGITSVEVAMKRLSDGKWWKNSVSSWDAVPEPLQAGTTPYWTWNFNAYLRDSLPNGASFYVTARAWDNSKPRNYGEFNVSGATFTYRDTTPPPATSTLGAAAGAYSGAVLLSWRTAGDNGAGGYLLDGRYKVAYSTWSGAPVSTTSAQVTFSTSTLTAGTTQYAVVSGLSPAATYYFTLWTADDALNWSPASNEAWAPAGTLDSGLLSGRVTDASANPVTGVLIEALAASGAVEGSDYTDVFGNYSIAALSSAYLTVRAVWAAEDIESSVEKDRVPNGAANVNFTLSVSYQLASISGFIPANFLAKPAARPAGLYTTKEVDTRVSGAFVEVYTRGRRIGAAFAAADGGFSVKNLLPGTYSLRVFNGSDFSEMRTVTLKPGENFLFAPKWALLNKDRVFAYPNPAASAVHLHFEPSAASYEAEAEVFDVAGRLVKRLTVHTEDNAVGPGTRRFTWDLARDGAAPGVYIYVLRVRDSSSGETAKAVKKFAVIR